MANQVIINPAALATSAAKYRKELLLMPIIAMQSTLDHMTLRTGIRGKETVGQLDGTIEVGPYSETRKDTSDTTIKGRELETFRGSVIKKFSPNSVADSIYGSAALLGKALTQTEITRQVVAFFAGKVSEGFNNSIFPAVRNAAGTATIDLFNGFNTIAAAEIAATTISVALKNMHSFGAAFSSTNGVDLLKAYYRASSVKLQAKQTKMFVSYAIYDAYCDDYQASNGALPYNTQFEKTYLEGSNNRCEIVPLANLSDSAYIYLTDKSNMLVGVDQMSDNETINVEKYESFVVTFEMVMYFGVQFETISPERLCVGKLFA